MVLRASRCPGINNVCVCGSASKFPMHSQEKREPRGPAQEVIKHWVRNLLRFVSSAGAAAAAAARNFSHIQALLIPTWTLIVSRGETFSCVRCDVLLIQKVVLSVQKESAKEAMTE